MSSPTANVDRRGSNPEIGGPKPFMFIITVPDGFQERKYTTDLGSVIHPETGDIWTMRLEPTVTDENENTPNGYDASYEHDEASTTRLSVTLDQDIKTKKKSFILPVKIQAKGYGQSTYADPHSSPPKDEPSRRYSWQIELPNASGEIKGLQLVVVVFYPRKGT